MSTHSSFESGYLELIWGPMFCGKTSTLLHRLTVHTLCAKRVLYINSNIDTRTEGSFSTHNPLLKASQPPYDQMKLSSLGDVPVDDYDVFGIDESQFFGTELVAVTKHLLDKNKIVYVAGLTGTSNMELFGEMFRLIPLANRLTTLSAICEVCSKSGHMVEANFTKRTVMDASEIHVGGHDTYVPVCRRCFNQ